jgi:phosphatidate cytidylyltransferase
MKTRVISAIVALIVFIPIFIMGGLLFKVVVFGVSVRALKEFMDIKDSKHKTPDFIKFISYITLALIVLGEQAYNHDLLNIDFRIIAELFLALLIPAVLYHNQDLYDVNDAFYLIGGLFFIGFAFNLLVILKFPVS